MMTFTDAVRTCAQKTLTIKGRAPRSEYWWFYLFAILTNIAVEIIRLVTDMIPVINIIFNLAALVFFLWMFIATVTVAIRRMHDVNKTGWILLLPLLAIAISGAGTYTMAQAGLWAGMPFVIAALVVMFYPFYLSLRKGTNGPNRFGEDPLVAENTTM